MIRRYAAHRVRNHERGASNWERHPYRMTFLVAVLFVIRFATARQATKNARRLDSVEERLERIERSHVGSMVTREEVRRRAAHDAVSRIRPHGRAEDIEDLRGSAPRTTPFP